jgi:hypothetical protein
MFVGKEVAMADAGFWVVWGLPSAGRERQALDLLKQTAGYLEDLRTAERIERFDTVILRPQTAELGGFILIQGNRDQLEALRADRDFQTWVTQVQLVADRVGIVDAWVNDGLDEAIGLYDEALGKLG